MRIRKNVKFLSNPEKTAFTNAVLALKKKPSILHPSDTSRSRYDDYPEIHMNAMMANPGWAHRGPAFFPWHRELLLQLENDLVASDPNVTIPYWDWTDPASGPFTPDFLGTNGSGANNKVTDGPFAFDGPNHWTIVVKDPQGNPPNFLQRSFGADPTAPNLPTSLDVATAQGVAIYDSAPWQDGSFGYRSVLESNLHNLVHRWVGGTMGQMTSPNDPVFWLHHCNIDRLWMLWQHQHSSSALYLPVSGAPQGQNLFDDMIFSMGGPAPFPGVATPASVLDTIPLGYTYDFVPRPAFTVPMSMVQILFGIINDAPGVFIGPDGKPHHEPGGPGDSIWQQLGVAERDRVLGSAIRQLSALTQTAEFRKDLENISVRLEGKQARAV
jgi:tyrosinase